MSAEWARAAAVSRSSTVTAGQSILARSWLTRVTTSASNAAFPDGDSVGDGLGAVDVGGALGLGCGGVELDGGGVTVAVAPGSPDPVAVGTGVGGVPSVVMTSLSMSGAAPTGLPNAM